MTRNIFIAAALFLLSASAHAAATDKLKNFIASTHSGQADFSQVLQDKNSKKSNPHPVRCSSCAPANSAGFTRNLTNN